KQLARVNFSAISSTSGLDNTWYWFQGKLNEAGPSCKEYNRCPESFFIPRFLEDSCVGVAQRKHRYLCG
ncbi:MAG: hypothetical protein ACYT04_72310, partial [Nostoc sp.]